MLCYTIRGELWNNLSRHIDPISNSNSNNSSNNNSNSNNNKHKNKTRIA